MCCKRFHDCCFSPPRALEPARLLSSPSAKSPGDPPRRRISYLSDGDFSKSIIHSCPPSRPVWGWREMDSQSLRSGRDRVSPQPSLVIEERAPLSPLGESAALNLTLILSVPLSFPLSWFSGKLRHFLHSNVFQTSL